MLIVAENDRELTVTPDTLSDAIFATMNSLDGFAPLRRSFESSDYGLQEFVASVTRNVLTQINCRFAVSHHGTSGRWHAAHKHFATLPEAMEECCRIKADGYGARVVDELKNVVVCNAEWQNDVVECEPQEVMELANGSPSRTLSYR